MTSREDLDPLHVFRFAVAFEETKLAEDGTSRRVEIGGGAFAECTGLEATMEPKLIKEGGRNYGAVQRAGPVTFGTVVLKRGVTRGKDLWRTFHAVAAGAYALRLTVKISLLDHAGAAVATYALARALPVKFKAADFNARSSEVGVEELHLAHEELTELSGD